MLYATWAELCKLQAIWSIATVLLSDVVTFLAVHACERDLRANVRAFASHGLATSRAGNSTHLNRVKHTLGATHELELICSGGGVRTRDLTIMSRAL